MRIKTQCLKKRVSRGKNIKNKYYFFLLYGFYYEFMMSSSKVSFDSKHVVIWTHNTLKLSVDSKKKKSSKNLSLFLEMIMQWSFISIEKSKTNGRRTSEARKRKDVCVFRPSQCQEPSRAGFVCLVKYSTFIKKIESQVRGTIGDKFFIFHRRTRALGWFFVTQMRKLFLHVWQRWIPNAGVLHL